jgi:NADH-quinone oxidoreductase subunit M
MDSLLTLLIFFPALAGMLGFMIEKENMRAYAIAVTAIEFLLSLLLWAGFDTAANGYQYIEHAGIISQFGINYDLGIDGISLFLIILSTFMTMIALIGLTVKKEHKNLVISILFLEMTMVGVFASLDVILFYLFWELSLVPMLYIIGAWGADLRIYAAVKFFLYTFAGSLIMLVGILYAAHLYHDATGVWSFSIENWQNFAFPIETQYWLFGAFFIGFAIKVPMFPFHTWLPYAHGQAPTIGSVILAAVLLKMGTYGFVRFSLPMFPDAAVHYITPIAIISLIMIIYAALIAYAQKDMKQVIAYSSISHMGVIVLGTFAMNVEGIAGSLFFMLSHGVVSGALFMLVGVIYDRRHTKLMSEFGGLATVMPRYATIFGIMLMASVGLPLTMGFVGEFLSLLGFFKISPLMTAIAGTSIIIGAVYMLVLFKKSFFGPVTNDENKKLNDLTSQELTALLPLVALVIFLGIYPKPILKPISNSVESMIHKMDQKAILPETKELFHRVNSNGKDK